ncbi:cupredoxin domain-containing protein [Dasania marina]|uniref:cupredoxin domain-containing protein n=1 Tax=Dasania marina TaxID=471499 RepID=UPI00036B52CD|nr:cupredoxin domain-containing protein [Dasania marina]|tara:strand:+ start:9835 stop:10203 length:369 start_codon:yes stop_codon:yes gene_type:complete
MLMINLAGLLLIALIVWWFWLYKPTAVVATEQGPVTVLVENGSYQPARIQLPAGQATTLRFMRKDASPCAKMVVFSDLEISAELPLNEATDISLPAMAAGHYAFTCQMQMYRGELIVGEPEK